MGKWGTKFIKQCAHLMIVISFILLEYVRTQEPQSWTFTLPGVSFVSFSPIYTSSQNQRISLRFRTRNHNGLIFCHYLKDLDIEELERINYKMCGELQQGIFVLNYRLMQFQEDGLSLGKALHNNQWHDLDVHLNSTSGELSVTLDEDSRVTSLNAYTRQNITSLLAWSNYSSAIYFGGTDPDTLFSDLYPHFIGCMSDIKFENKFGRFVPISVSMQKGVVEGCVDKCSSNPCHHGGSCINGYSDSICDCFSTDYQGKFCAELGPTTVTLRGYEWLEYFMYMDDETILTENTRFSLEFKTSRGSGVLFYAAGGTPYHSHLTASVHDGTIKVSFGFGEEDIAITVGMDVDNYRWHNLTIQHDNHTVYVYLDGEVEHRHILGTIYHLGLHPRVFIGGGNNFVVTRGLQVTQNFVGCIKNVYIDEVSVLYELANQNPAVIYHGGGSSIPEYICEEVVNIPLSFPTARAKIMLDPTTEMKEYFEIEFDFKTVRNDGVLLYVGLMEVDTFEFNFGYFEVWIKDGQPYLEFVPATLHPERTQNRTIGVTVNNNLWNTMHLSFNDSVAKLKVNGISVGTDPIDQTLKINNKIVLGYGFNIKSYKDSDGFVGCLRNLKIQNKILDALDLMETDLVSDVIIDGCNITNYCHDNQMCQHGGKCLSEWRGVTCDCSETFYTGNACHFPKYKCTCDEYYQAGVTESQVLLVNLDGSGPDDPILVQCEMAKYKRTCDEYYQAGVTESQVMLVDLDGSGPDDPLLVQSKYKRTCDEYYQAGVTESQVMLVDLDGSGPDDPLLVQSKYKRTCDEYYQAGVTESQVMLVDLDGSGPDDPILVQCEMGHQAGFEFFGRTIVEHNMLPNTTVRGPMMRNLQLTLTYRGLDTHQLKQLTSQSGYCEQYIRYDCKQATLGLGNVTWFRAASGEMVDYLGNNKPGFCPCSTPETPESCTDRRCNCDKESTTHQFDAGYNNKPSQLPITEVNVKQDESTLGRASANLTIGPLACWGNSYQMPDTAVTFSNASGYLLNHPWKSGEIRISFRTHFSQAIIMYQTGTRENINIFLVAVTSEYTVKFYFRWGMKWLDVDVTTPTPISNGQWHAVSIETDQYNVRCMVDMTERIMGIPQDIPNVKLFSGILYIGGVPDTVYKDAVVWDIDGIVGCMRGLYYNGRSYPLKKLVDSSTFAVTEECMASCWPNPCQNGATCIEQWETHECICANQWAHSGHNCEIDINTDAVTFLGRPNSYLHFKQDYNLNLLDKSIIFSFRTFLRSALIFYMHDHYNNFIQVELKEGKRIVAKFNRYSVIMNQTKLVTGYLNDGAWHQVVIDNQDGYLKVIVDVDDDLTRNSFRKKNRERYSTRPFNTGENVLPPRPALAPSSGFHVYLGGVPTDMSSLPTLYGCVRGLKIGDTIFSLQEKAVDTQNVSPLCVDGCDDMPCKHGGICQEQWQDRQFECDCRFSEYAGPTCNTESAGLFKGDSILQYKYKPPSGAEETVTERLELIFKVSPDATDRMILVFIYSERYVTHDFLIVYLDPKQGVYVNTNHGYAIHGFGKYGNFADGRPHQLVYERKKSEMLLTVRKEGHPKFRNKSISLDEEGVGRVTVPSNSLDELDTIMVGGILESQFNTIRDTADYRRYSNFTGCLSEVIFKPNSEIPFALRPLKDVRDDVNTTGTAIVYGSPLEKCMTRNDVILSTTTAPPPTYRPTDKEYLTLPPWNPGPAKVVYFGDPPVIQTPPPTTKQTTPTTSTAMETEMIYETRETEKHDNKIAFISLALVAFLVLLAILIAAVLVRIRRREEEEEKKKKKQPDVEMKAPLNDIEGPIRDNQQNQNYLARLDEFSMVSASFGARPVKMDGTSTFKPQPSDSSYAYSSVPQSDDDAPTTAEKRFYNRKKNRPASSISEVLEEMERQRGAIDADQDDLETLGNGPLQPHQINMLPCDHIYTSIKQDQGLDETRFCEIPEEKLPSDSLPSTETPDDDVGNDADNESDTPSPLPPLHIRHEYNGDSGYEAESKPEDDEDDTIMNDSFHDKIINYNADVTSNTSLTSPTSPDSHTYNVYSTGTSPPSPESRNGNFSSDDVSSPIHAGHDLQQKLPSDYKRRRSSNDKLKSPVIESQPIVLEPTSNHLHSGSYT